MYLRLVDRDLLIRLWLTLIDMVSEPFEVWTAMRHGDAEERVQEALAVLVGLGRVERDVPKCKLFGSVQMLPQITGSQIVRRGIVKLDNRGASSIFLCV